MELKVIRSCGDLRFVDVNLVRMALVENRVATVVAVTLVPDRRLMDMARDMGIAHLHHPLRTGMWQILQYRAAVKAVRQAARRGAVLVVGETALPTGAAAKVAAEARGKVVKDADARN